MINLIASRKINLKETLAAVILSLFILSALSSMASAQSLAGGLGLNPTQGAAGTSVIVSGTGFVGAVTVYFNYASVGTATAGGNGAWTATVTVPATLPAAQYTVTATDSVGHTGSAVFVVTSSAVTAPPVTTTPTPAPVVTPTPASTATPTPKVPEFAAPILVVIALAGVTLGAIAKKKIEIGPACAKA